MCSAQKSTGSKVRQRLPQGTLNAHVALSFLRTLFAVPHLRRYAVHQYDRQL